MKNQDDRSLEAQDDLLQMLSPEPLEGRQRTVAEWTGDLLLGIRPPVQFRLADWP